MQTKDLEHLKAVLRQYRESTKKVSVTLTAGQWLLIMRVRALLSGTSPFGMITIRRPEDYVPFALETNDISLALDYLLRALAQTSVIQESIEAHGDEPSWLISEEVATL
jgi:hypothetical protein